MRDLSGLTANLAAKTIVFLFPLMVVTGTILTVYGGYMLYKSDQSRSWPSTDGVIRTAQIERHFDSGTPDHTSSTTFAASVTYNYTVDGKRFTGQKIRMVEGFTSDESSALADVSKYPVGKQVKVSYSPADPADSVLEPGIHPSSWSLPIFGCAFVVIPALMMSIAFIVSSFRHKRRIVETNPFGA